MYKRHKIGRDGEDFAVYYLEEHGYKILQRNFACKLGEIDIIAFDGKTIVFFEIKSRTSSEYGLPAEAVNTKKIKHMLKTAQYYLYKNNLECNDIRIDVIEVFINKDKYRINHIKQIL